MLIHVYSIRVNMDGEYREWHDTVHAEPIDMGWMSRSGTYSMSLYNREVQCSYIDSGYKAIVATEYEDINAYSKLRKALWGRDMYDLEEHSRRMLKCLDKLSSQII